MRLSAPRSLGRRLGYQVMEETICDDWWMDAESNWHRGRPQAGWWQADDRRWHAPDDYDDDDPTGEIEGGPPTGAAHYYGRRSPPPDPDQGWGWPRWARRAVLASLAIVAVGIVGAAAIIDGGPDQSQPGTTTTTALEGAPVHPGSGPQAPQTTSTIAAASGSDVDDPSAPSSDEQASGTASPPVTSPTSAPPPTSPPPSSAGARPGAICSPEGATAVTAAGVPLTCTVEKCHGAPFDAPRWRRATC